MRKVAKQSNTTLSRSRHRREFKLEQKSLSVFSLKALIYVTCYVKEHSSFYAGNRLGEGKS